MSSISAKEVNELRKVTGAGIMDCKKALEESQGDFEKAIEVLRIKGQKVSAARQDRDAKEGVVFAKVNADNTVGIIFEVNCETDFVAKNDDFVALFELIAQNTIENQPANLEALNQMAVDGKPVSDHVVDIVSKIREKIEISRYAIVKADRVNLYIHQGAKIGVVVGFQNTGSVDMATVGKDVAMQIAAMKPIAVSKESVPQEVTDKEMEIALEQVRSEGKPENMVEKIALGKVQKFYKENCLVEQEFIKDAAITVGKYLSDQNKDLKVTEFVRFGISDR